MKEADTTVALDKKLIRKEIIEARRALSESERAEMSSEICKRLEDYLKAKESSIILSYAAFDGEPDLSEFHSWAKAQGKIVAFPLICGDGLMDACVPDDDRAWITGKFGILAPDPERSHVIAPEEIDVVLAPCVCFDLNKVRLGRGGGFYDRYLPRCPQAEHIAVAYDFQRIGLLPEVQPWDVPVDTAVTEKALY